MSSAADKNFTYLPMLLETRGLTLPKEFTEADMSPAFTLLLEAAKEGAKDLDTTPGPHLFRVESDGAKQGIQVSVPGFLGFLKLSVEYLEVDVLEEGHSALKTSSFMNTLLQSLKVAKSVGLALLEHVAPGQWEAFNFVATPCNKYIAVSDEGWPPRYVIAKVVVGIEAEVFRGTVDEMDRAKRVFKEDLTSLVDSLKGSNPLFS